MNENYEIIDYRNNLTNRQIDYERMAREYPRQRELVVEAVDTGDPVRVAEVVIETVRVWDEIGAWPDDWAMLQRALDDVLPWNTRVDVDDVAYGRVVIRRTEAAS